MPFVKNFPHIGGLRDIGATWAIVVTANMGPFLTNCCVIKMSISKGIKLSSPQRLSVPCELLSRTLDLISHQGAVVQDISVQAATSTPAPPAQKPPAAVSKEKQTRAAGSRQRRSRTS
jgi:hypothetical protein